MTEAGDAQWRLALIRDHYDHPRHRGALPEADVVMPGGNPGCGDVVVVYLKGDGKRLLEASFEGRGCTVSQAAASMVMERAHQDGLNPQAILAWDYQSMEELLGADVVRARPRCATLALATLKAAVRAYLRKHQAQEAGVEVPAGPSPQEVQGLVLGEAAWEAAGQHPHE